jgi:type I restriction enzyme M protein
MVLTNPPFGKKSSYKVTAADGETETETMSYLREDFGQRRATNSSTSFSTSARSSRSMGAQPSSFPTTCFLKAAQVKPYGGACSTSAIVTRSYVCRPASSTLAAKANVLFFDRKPPWEIPWTKKLWIYDFRTNQSFTLKTRTLTRPDLDDFVACYDPANRHERTETERFRPFTYEELSRAIRRRSTSPGSVMNRWKTLTICRPQT